MKILCDFINIFYVFKRLYHVLSNLKKKISFEMTIDSLVTSFRMLSTARTFALIKKVQLKYIPISKLYIFTCLEKMYRKEDMKKLNIKYSISILKSILYNIRKERSDRKSLLFCELSSNSLGMAVGWLSLDCESLDFVRTVTARGFKPTNFPMSINA